MMESKKFVIVDAMALAYRAYFVFINRPLVTSKGEPTSAVYGFINQIIKILEDTKPDYLAVAFDSEGETFRHKKYKEYKSSRAKMPDDMIPQIDRIKEIVEMLSIPIFIKKGYEADDIIGTAVKEAEQEGLDSYVITPDKDFNQLITKKVKIIKPGKSSDELLVIDSKKVKEDYGFEPKLMIDYLALIGDKADDIPGIAGIGPKTAVPIIQKFGTVENIYRDIEKVDKESLKKKLIESKENALLSKDLATIDVNVPIKINFEKAKITKPNFEKLKEIFIELEFKSFFSRLLNYYEKETNAEVKDIEIPEEVFSYDAKKTSYKLVNDEKNAKELVAYLNKHELIVFDTETDSLDQFNLHVVGASFSTKEKEGFYVPINPFKDDRQKESKENIPIDNFIKLFKPVFENKKIKKVCQNGKFDIAVLRNLGIDVENFYFDTMLASYVIDPDQKHGMDDLSEKYLHYKPIPISTLIGEKKDPSKIFEANLEDLSVYSSEDADITYRLYKILDKEIKKEKLQKLAFNVEFPLVPVLEDMERTGIRVDKESLNSLSKDLQILIDNYTKKIYELSGEEFNINSPQQLQKILFNKLGLKGTKKTKTGYSTNAQALETLKGQHEIIDVILEYRTVSKLKSTYADSLPNLINPKTGRIHTSFNQTVASTGRLSSNEPNLQNIPIRTDIGKEVRKAFVPKDKNHVILSADYSQIELRIMAHISGDEGLTRAFKHKEDIHTSTAALVFMVDPKDVTPDMRRKAKEVNFGILYGIGPYGLKIRLGITQSHAKEIIETYFNSFKKVKNFMNESVVIAKEKGYAETLMGRRRYLRNINSSNRVVRQFEERVAINMRVQGTAADMIKIAMINIYNELNKRKLKSKMVLQVHDELIFDAHKKELDELRPLVKELMENALPLKVPVVADTGVGDNWLDAH